MAGKPRPVDPDLRPRVLAAAVRERGHVPRMARSLGVTEMTINRWVRKLGLQADVSEIRRRATARYRLPTLEEFEDAVRRAEAERGIRAG